jgi:hypothetical protein
MLEVVQTLLDRLKPNHTGYASEVELYVGSIDTLKQIFISGADTYEKATLHAQAGGKVSSSGGSSSSSIVAV